MLTQADTPCPSTLSCLFWGLCSILVCGYPPPNLNTRPALIVVAHCVCVYAAGQNAHSSNASGPPATPGPPHDLDRPASKASHDGSQEDRAAGESPASVQPPAPAAGTACAAGTAGPQDPASVDEVLKHFLQSNDKLASLSLTRLNGDMHGRQDGDPSAVCTPRRHPTAPMRMHQQLRLLSRESL